MERRGERTRVELTGELDLASAEELRGRLEEIQDEGPDLLVLDLRRLEFMDSTGLREIIGVVRRARTEGRDVALVKRGGSIEDVLDLTRVDQLAPTVDDPAAVGFPDHQ